MASEWTNPIGVDGFGFVEFAADESDALGAVFEALGFRPIARHQRKNLVRYRQGGVDFLLNCDESVAAFRAAHGPGVCGMAFRVRDALSAFDEALRRDAQAAENAPLGVPALKTVGGAHLYLVDAAHGAKFDQDFQLLAPAAAASDVGLRGIDHVAHNLERGHLRQWQDFYERVFNFRRVRYFHISGKQSGFVLTAMASPCGKIRIPLNESQNDGSQIEEFLRAFKGEGVQHIGLAAADIHTSVAALRTSGVAFQVTPDSYYETLPARVPASPEEVARLKADGVLLDGDESEGLLKQIFTRNIVGPLFFELIERRGNEGFGEGNVTALFESVEADQLRRGAKGRA